MKKIKLLIPLGIATLTGAMMPLVSCGCGNGGQDEPGIQCDALCFTDIAGDGIESHVKIRVFGQVDPHVDVDLETSTDGKTWTEWFKVNAETVIPKESDLITLHDGEHVYIRNKKDKLSYGDEGAPKEDFNFRTDGAIKLSGNINSMINYKELSDFCFGGLFAQNQAITSIDDLSLPSTTLVPYCYHTMFLGCSGLTTIPESLLKSNTLAKSCYEGMFTGCSGLTAIPENLLRANTLANDCYSGMFRNCLGLITIPENLLNANELAQGCYRTMFQQCTNLTTACKLPAETLVDECYISMFYGCSSLKIEEKDETTEANKIFTCPDTTTCIEPVNNMFTNTFGPFTTSPTMGNTYYWE